MAVLYLTHPSLDERRLVQREEDPLAEGGDGKIVRLSGAVSEAGVPLLAKLYHDPTPERRHKLVAMLKAPPEACTVPDPGAEHGTRVQIAWPTHLIENEAGEILGFAMPEVNLSGTTVLETLLSRRSREAHWLSESYRKRFGAAQNLAMLVGSLHAQKHHVVDLKPVNAQLYRQTFYVALLDTDGFSVHALVEDSSSARRYPAHQYTPGYIAPEAGRDGKAPEELGEAQDRFALAVVIFQLLNQGLHPFQGVPNDGQEVPTTNQERINGGMYAYGRDEHPAQRPSPWSLHLWFDDATRAMFDRAFSDEAAGGRRARPSAAAWTRHLSQYTGSSPGRLRPCDKDPAHARFLGHPCGLCELEEKRGEDKRQRARDRQPEPSATPHAPRQPKARQRPSLSANATKQTATSPGTHASSKRNFWKHLVQVPKPLTPWGKIIPALFLCLVATVGVAIFPAILTTEVSFGDSSPPFIEYVQHLFFWLLVVSPMTAIVGVNFSSFRSTWLGLTLIIGTCGTSVLVGELSPFTAWLLCVTLYGGYYYAFFFWVPRINTFKAGTFALLMVLFSLAVVILSVVASAFLSMMIYGHEGHQVTTSPVPSSTSSRPRIPQIPSNRLHVGVLTPVNGEPVVYLEEGIWMDDIVSIYRIRGLDTVQVRSKMRFTGVRPWGHTAGISSFTPDDTVLVVARSPSGLPSHRVQQPFDADDEAAVEAYRAARFRSTTITDTVEIEAPTVRDSAYTVPVQFLMADDGSVYVSAKQTLRGRPLKNVYVEAQHGKGMYDAIWTSDHDSQARILNIASGATVRVRANVIDPYDSKRGYVFLTVPFPAPTTTALPTDRILQR